MFLTQSEIRSVWTSHLNVQDHMKLLVDGNEDWETCYGQMHRQGKLFK